MNKAKGKLLGQFQCPECAKIGKDNKKDNLAVYNLGADGLDAWCWSCNVYITNQELLETIIEDVSVEPKTLTAPVFSSFSLSLAGVSSIPFKAFTERKIRIETAKKFGVKQQDGKRFYPVTANGKIKGYRCRRLPKEFSPAKGATPVGDINQSEFFGQHLFQGVKKDKGSGVLIITEGEEDAMSAYQMTRDRSPAGTGYASISVPTGKSSLIKAIKENYEFLQSFSKVIFALDQEPETKDLVREACRLMPPGLAYIASFEEKDASDMLVKGKEKAFYNAIWDAKEYKPEGLVLSSETWKAWKERNSFESVPLPKEWGLSHILPGVRLGGLYTIGAGCVSCDTEYLTPTGWKRIDSYTTGDFVAQYHEEGHVSFIDDPLYVKLPEERFLSLDGKRGISQKLSAEHRVVSFAKHTKKLKIHHVYEIEDKLLAGKFQRLIKTTAKGIVQEGDFGEEFSENEMRLIVAIIADGCLRTKNKGMVRILLKKPRKIARLTKLLEETGTSYSLHKAAPGCKAFYFKAPLAVKSFDSRFFKLAKKHHSVVAEEVQYWDGAENIFYTSNKESADFVQALWSSLGFSATLATQVRRDGKKEFRIIKTSRVYRSANRLKAKWVPSEDGFKYCFQVPTGMLVLRHNGRIFVTGNTGVGKSSMIKTLQLHLWNLSGDAIGVISLEEPLCDSVGLLMGLHMKKRLHLLNDREIDESEEHKAWEELFSQDRFVFEQGFGGLTPEDLFDKIRYMVRSKGAKYIFIDHLTALTDLFGDGKGSKIEQTARLVAQIKALTQELECAIIQISHVRKRGDETRSYEEGAVPGLDSLYGAAAIKQYSDCVITISRDQRKDPSVTQYHVIKNRLAGRLGAGAKLVFDFDTGWLVSYKEEEQQEQEVL